MGLYLCVVCCVLCAVCCVLCAVCCVLCAVCCVLCLTRIFHGYGQVSSVTQKLSRAQGCRSNMGAAARTRRAQLTVHRLRFLLPLLLCWSEGVGDASRSGCNCARAIDGAIVDPPAIEVR